MISFLLSLVSSLSPLLTPSFPIYTQEMIILANIARVNLALDEVIVKPYYRERKLQ